MTDRTSTEGEAMTTPGRDDRTDDLTDDYGWMKWFPADHPFDMCQCDDCYEASETWRGMQKEAERKSKR